MKALFFLFTIICSLNAFSESGGSPVHDSSVIVYDQQLGAICSGVVISEHIVLTSSACLGRLATVIFDVNRIDLNEFYSAFVSGHVTAFEARFGAVVLEPDRILRAGGSSQNDPENFSPGYLVFRKLPIGYKPAIIADRDQNTLPINKTSLLVAGFGKGKYHEAVVELEFLDSKNRYALMSPGSCAGDWGAGAYLHQGGLYRLWGIAAYHPNYKSGSDMCNENGVYIPLKNFLPEIRRNISFGLKLLD